MQNYRRFSKTDSIGKSFSENCIQTQDVLTRHDSDDGVDSENRVVGTWTFDEYPTFEEWSAQFDFSKPANMKALEPVHFGHLPVWSEGNLYLGGARAWKKEVNGQVVENTSSDVRVELVEKDGKYYLDTNVYEFLGEFGTRMIPQDRPQPP